MGSGPGRETGFGSGSNDFAQGTVGIICEGASNPSCVTFDADVKKKMAIKTKSNDKNANILLSYHILYIVTKDKRPLN